MCQDLEPNSKSGNQIQDRFNVDRRILLRVTHQPSKLHGSEFTATIQHRPPPKSFFEVFSPVKEVFLKLALVDPDTALPLSPAVATSLSFYRVEDNFESGQTINAIFLEACQTVFSDQCISGDRRLHRTIFSGKDRDSGSTISVTVVNPTALQDEVINEFDPLFNVTFKLHSKHVYNPVATTPLSVAKFPLFNSIAERKKARLQLQDDESGDHLPLLRAEWCQLRK